MKSKFSDFSAGFICGFGGVFIPVFLPVSWVMLAFSGESPNSSNIIFVGYGAGAITAIAAWGGIIYGIVAAAT